MTGPLMIDIEGTELSDEDYTLLGHPMVGGLIFFSRNFENAAQIAELSASIKLVRPDIILAVDQEGGRVQRFREGYTSLPPMAVFGQAYRQDRSIAKEHARTCGWLMASEILASGIDISFAPVLDVECGISQVIGDRSFSIEVPVVIEVAEAFIGGMHEAGMAATGKHFPGHGSVAADSHEAIPVDDRQRKSIFEHDLEPFRALAKQLDAVMPAHVIYPEVCSRAAGFSHYWLQDCLRGELGFNGVIFSDDLNMEGARVAGSYAESALAALQTGCDMILICNNRPATLEILTALDNADFIKENPRLGKLLAGKPQALTGLQQTGKWQEAVEIISSYV